MFSITLALKDTDGNQATTFKDKEDIVRRPVFPKPSEDPVVHPSSRSGIAPGDIDTETVH